MLRYFFIAKRGVILTKTTKVKEIDEDENIATSVVITRVFNTVTLTGEGMSTVTVYDSGLR